MQLRKNENLNLFFSLIVGFLLICKCQLNENLLFLKTAILIFCLTYSLNIPHSNQNLSFFPVEGKNDLFKIDISATFYHIVVNGEI